MRQLTCEMCGSTDLIKQDGVFVCQTCGCKYSVEEAKKMMIEGTVDVSGSTVKVDSSEELDNLFELARRAKSNNDSTNAKLYYTRILEKQPSNWEAAFYSMYYTATSTTLGQLENNTINVVNGLDSVASLILQLPEDERVVAKNEFKYSLLQLFSILMSGVMQKADGYSDPSKALDVLNNSSSVVATLLIRAGDVFLTRLDDTENAKMFYKKIIDYKGLSKGVVNTAIDRSNKALKEGVKRQQEKRERQRKEKIAAYWSEHKEDKARLENEQKGLEREMDSLSARIKAIEKEIAPKLKELQAEKDEKTPFELEVDKQTSLIRDLQSQYDNCGPFKGKEKKAIQGRIDSQEKPKLERLKTQAESERRLVDDRINAEIDNVKAKSVRLYGELSSLQKKRDSITEELTKDR